MKNILKLVLSALKKFFDVSSQNRMEDYRRNFTKHYIS